VERSTDVGFANHVPHRVDLFAASQVESDISESRVRVITSGHFLMIVLI
jgi:hypothetical protein